MACTVAENPSPIAAISATGRAERRSLLLAVMVWSLSVVLVREGRASFIPQQGHDPGLGRSAGDHGVIAEA